MFKNRTGTKCAVYTKQTVFEGWINVLYNTLQMVKKKKKNRGLDFPINLRMRISCIYTVYRLTFIHIAHASSYLPISHTSSIQNFSSFLSIHTQILNTNTIEKEEKAMKSLNRFRVNFCIEFEVLIHHYQNNMFSENGEWEPWWILY